MFSKHQKKMFFRKIAIIFLPRLMWAFMWFLYLTNRKTFFTNAKMFENNFIAAFWHGECLMLPFLYLHARKKMSKERDKGFYIISSQHFDGELMVKLYGYFGLKNIRGSSSKGALKVLVDGIKILKSGADMGITPDGPKGPYHSIADGVVAMSLKSGVDILPLRVKFSSYWELPTWDKMRIPKPFGKIEFHALDGFKASDYLDSEKLDSENAGASESGVQNGADSQKLDSEKNEKFQNLDSVKAELTRRMDSLGY